jgi:hypothetical protein
MVAHHDIYHCGRDFSATNANKALKPEIVYLIREKLRPGDQFSRTSRILKD